MPGEQISRKRHARGGRVVAFEHEGRHLLVDLLAVQGATVDGGGQQCVQEGHLLPWRVRILPLFGSFLTQGVHALLNDVIGEVLQRLQSSLEGSKFRVQAKEPLGPLERMEGPHIDGVAHAGSWKY